MLATLQNAVRVEVALAGRIPTDTNHSSLLPSISPRPNPCRDQTEPETIGR